MAKAKTDKYDILISVIDAIFDFNKRCKVETLRRNKKVMTPRRGFNFESPDSFRIGDISVRETNVTQPDMFGQNYYHKNYVIRTPQGEAVFDADDNNLRVIWYALAQKEMKGVALWDDYVKEMKSWFKLLPNTKLRAHAAAAKVIEKDSKESKFKRSAQKLKALGVKTDKKELEEKLEKEVRVRALRRRLERA